VIEVDHHINAVRRTVGDRTLEEGEVRVITISRSYPTGAEDLWDACTNAERLPRWFAPVSGDLRLGGTFSIEGNAGGTILTCEPPTRFTATWECAGMNPSWIELTIIAEDEEQSRFELSHIVPVDDHWEQFGPGAVGVGWDLAVLGLAMYLCSGQAVDREFSATFHLTDDGRAYISRSSEAWREAGVVGGADPGWSTLAADRTAAAFSGEVGS
jgi:uncharacterized protein YndB with AHSA1/START domain